MSMTTTADAPRGLLYRLPLIGRIARELHDDFTGTFGYFLVTVFTLLVLAVKTWGPVALAMSALAMVPVVFVLLILITVGK
ncbi:MAG: hypothetical protein ACU0DK_15210 [Pseudooceanicola sp.]